jgi:asparagine synthase (glutamine-hydrolysing)
MSAIAGVFQLDSGPIDSVVLARMLEAVPHRGPDAKGIWQLGSVGLGHRLLQTTPESIRERQPLLNDDGTVCLTADARVDNRAELKAALESRGARLRSDTDAELLLQAYEIWGEDCAQRIIGDFAFAVWDTRLRRLFCARDPIGVKPFHYWCDGTRFVWASEPCQILIDPLIPLEPNRQALGSFLLLKGIDRQESLYENIHRLPAAHGMTVDRTGIHPRRYWDLDRLDEIRYRKSKDYAEHFRSVLTEAVQCRLRSSTSVSAFLSGGLDSSSVVAIAHNLCREGRASSQTLDTYSILFGSLGCDERDSIEETVEKHSLKAHFVQFEDVRTLDLDRARVYPGVLYDPTTYACFSLLQSAREQGSRVCLWGTGGDEVLTPGSSYLATLLRHGRIGPCVTQLRYAAGVCSVPAWKFAWDYCVRPAIPGVAKAPFRVFKRQAQGEKLPGWFKREFIQRTSPNSTVQTTVFKAFKSSSQRQLYAAIIEGWQIGLLLGHLDAMASSHGAEFRHPFLDRRLIEFVMRVPDREKIGRGETKALLRNAVRDILPDRVVNRLGKVVFTHANDSVLRRHQESVRVLLAQSKLAEMGVVDSGFLIRMFNDHCRDDAPRDLLTVQRISSAILNVLRLELWLRHLPELERERRVNGRVRQRESLEVGAVGQLETRL